MVRDQWARYLTHLLLNQFGNSWWEEALLHAHEAVGRIHLLEDNQQNEAVKRQLTEILGKFEEGLQMLLPAVVQVRKRRGLVSSQ